MGNPLMDAVHDVHHDARVNTFYSSKSWIDGKAINQLHHVSQLAGVHKIAAFPDLHIGKFGPVGCAILADRIYPQLIGNDIGCGISVFVLDMPVRKLKFDKAVKKMRDLEKSWSGDKVSTLRHWGLSSTLHDDKLGSLGGGNHFCEIQKVGELHDPRTAEQLGLLKNSLLLMVHSGSRSLGAEIFDAVQHLSDGILANTKDAEHYLEKHDAAVSWAKLNRQIIAHRVARLFHTSCRLIADSPHNLIETVGGNFLHRKGAVKADIAAVPLAGSRDSFSFLLKPTQNIPPALNSISHGAGRKYDRKSMPSRVGGTKSAIEKLKRTSFGGHVICDDKQLLLEDAPIAYKNSQTTIDELHDFGLIQTIATLHPLITFKKSHLSYSQEMHNDE